MNLWRKICILLDTGVYAFVETILQSIIDLANVEIFSKTTIDEFSRRIYIVLGLVMMFKLMISFIQILINPDKMNDKENGVGGVLKRTVISLALIVLVPSIFDLARQIQNYVVPVIPKVIVGATIDTNSDDGSQTVSETTAQVGASMAWYSFLPFFTYNNTACDHGQIMGIGTNLSSNSTTVPEIYSVYTAASKVNEKCPESTDSNGYCYQYRWLISTAVGIYLVYTLLTVAVRIAIRTIKLGVCEFIAPIPISSYIDPKTSKQAFDNWVKTSIHTYLDLFIDLIVVYFVIFVFQTVFVPNNIKLIYERLGGDFIRGSLVTLFLIIGLLQFAKKAPKFISDMLGIKGSGNIGEIFKGGGFKGLAGLAGTALASTRTAKTNFRTSRGAGESFGTSLRRAVGGFAGAQKRGLTAVADGRGYGAAYHENFAKSTSISARRVAARATKKQSKEENLSKLNELAGKRDAAIAKANADYENAINDYNNFNAAYANKSREDILEELYQQKRMAAQGSLTTADASLANATNAVTAATNYENELQNKITAARAAGNTADENKYRLALNAARIRTQEAINAKTAAQTARDNAKAEFDRIDARNLNPDEIAEMNAGVNKINSDLAKFRQAATDAAAVRDAAIDEANSQYESDARLVPNEINPVKAAILDQVLGRQSVVSETYTKAASTMTSTKAEALGEARGKLVEEGADLIIEVKGKQMAYKEVLDAYNRLEPGKDQVLFDGKMIDKTEFNSIYATATKKADVAYVDAVARGTKSNAKIEKILKNFDDFLNTLEIDDTAIVDELKNLYRNSPGLAIKKAGDYAEGMQRKGNQMATIERIHEQEKRDKESKS